MDNTAAPVEVEGQSSKREEKQDFYGIPLTVEWRAGDMRTFERPDYSPMLMSADYGEIDNTVSNEEGDALDCFLPKGGPVNDSVFIAVMDNDDGELEEEKVFLGFEDIKAAEFSFTQHYGEEKLRFVYAMTLENFKKFLDSRVPEVEHKTGGEGATGVEDAYVEATREPTLVLDLESKPEVLQKSLNKVPLASLHSALTQSQLVSLMELRKSHTVKGLPVDVEAPRLGSDGLMDPRDLVSTILAKGTNGPGHRPGSPFSARKASYEEYGILVLFSQDVYPENIAKALGISEDDVVKKLKGWMVIPRT